MRAVLVPALLVACSSNPPTAAPPDAARAIDGAIVVGDGPPATDATVPADAVPDAFVDRGVEQDYDDLATTVVGIARTAQLAAMIDTTNIAYAVPPAFLTLVQPGEYAGLRGGVSYDYTFECEDASDVHSPTCGPTMDHIHMLGKLDGAVMVDTLAMPEFKLTAHWIERDIDQNKPRVEGTGHMLVASTLSTTGTAFELTIDGTYTHVRVEPTPSLPSSGSIAYSISAQRTRATATPSERTFTAAATLTFAAGGQATIVLDGTHSYTVDMETGAVTRM